MVPVEKLAKVYVRVIGWRKKYVPCPALIIPTRPLFALIGKALLKNSRNAMPGKPSQ